MTRELDSMPCHYIGRRLRWAGISVTDETEKYGTWRVYCSFGRFYITYNPLLHMYNALVVPLQKRWYRQVYRMALRKFPDEAYAIVMGADWTELLVGLDNRLVRTKGPSGITRIDWRE